jgi:hypothetical protein
MAFQRVVNQQAIAGVLHQLVAQRQPADIGQAMVGAPFITQQLQATPEIIRAKIVQTQLACCFSQYARHIETDMQFPG